VDADQDRPLSPIIALSGVTRRFGEAAAVDGVTLDIGRGEFFCLVGASGSGKTTLLRMIAGLDAPDAGRIAIDGEDMTARPAYRRPVNMMFQSYALFPHLTVAGNVAFGLQEEGRPKAEIERRVAAALNQFDMGAFARRKPHQLSGGQRQRVALARALVKEPKILLLDEPLAALDKKLRSRAQTELVRLRERLGITFVMVTHDQEEAMAMASRIALMREGRVVQVGTPHEIYEAPVSRYVADFFGEANLFEGRVSAVAEDVVTVACADCGSPVAARGADGVAVGASVAVLVRPEHVRLAAGNASPPGSLTGRLESVTFLGSFYACVVVLDGGKRLTARLSPAEFAAAGHLTSGAPVRAYWDAGAARVLTQ
jgi:putrescine transport system ATP-binding protein